MTDTRMNPSRIIGLQFSLLSPEEIRKGSVANIVSRDTYVNNKPVIGGLFDPRMGVLEPGLICPSDGLDYIQIAISQTERKVTTNEFNIIFNNYRHGYYVAL